MKAKKFLASLIATVMMLSTMVCPAFADGTAVAKVGNVQYNTLQEAIAAADEGDTVTLLNNITYDDETKGHHILVDKNLILDLGQYTITSTADGQSYDNGFRDYKGDIIEYAPSVILICAAPDAANSSATLTINATTGGIKATGANRYVTYSGRLCGGYNCSYDCDSIKSNLIINGGSYEAAADVCIYQNNGLCTINGGSFKADFPRTVLNAKQYYMGDVAINGGSFCGFNPACMSIRLDGNKYYHIHDRIAEGKSISYEDGWYTVVENGIYTPIVETKSLCYPTAGAAMNAIVGMNDVSNLGIITLLGNDGLTLAETKLAIDNDFSFILGEYTLTLPEGYSLKDVTLEGNREVKKIKAPVAKIGETEYATLEEAIAAAQSGATIEIADGTYSLPASIANKNITFTGSKNVVIEMYNAVNATGSTIAFNGVTVKFGNDAYKGLQHSTKVTYNNCTHYGTEFLYAPEVAYTGCTFEMNDNATEYAVWTYGAKNVTFDNCKFNTNGKAILVYNESSTDDFVAEIKLASCNFYSNGTFEGKAAVETGQTPYGTNTYNLDFDSCTADEKFSANKSTSNLWGNKNSIKADTMEVVIDKEVVYGLTWATATDAGYFMDGDTKKGLMRYLLNVSGTGIGEIGVEAVTEKKTNLVLGTNLTGESTYLFGVDFIFTEAEATKTAYTLKGYATINGEMNYSEEITNTPNWSRELDYKGGNE